MTNITSAVEVTQEDREAAYEMLVRTDDNCGFGREYIRNGLIDHLPTVQAFARHRLAALEEKGWQSIDSAPRDGTTIDVWRDGTRETVYWGFPPHECGEMGSYCDSDWHSIVAPGWICSTFGEFVGGKHDPFTHWMPLPNPPANIEQAG